MASSKRRLLRRSKNQCQNVKRLHAHVTKLDSPEAAGEVSHGDFMGKDAGTFSFLIMMTCSKKC